MHLKLILIKAPGKGLDVTTRLLHMREISGPQTVSIPRSSSLSNLLLLLILTGSSQAGSTGKHGRKRTGRGGARNSEQTLGRLEAHTRLMPSTLFPQLHPPAQQQHVHGGAAHSPAQTWLHPVASRNGALHSLLPSPSSLIYPAQSLLASSFFLILSFSKNHGLTFLPT